MKVVSANAENTVGICTDIEHIHNIGEFDIVRLKEWIKLAENMYGLEHTVQLFVRKSDVNHGFIIAASSDGTNPFVTVAGKYPTDGKPWDGEY